MACPESVQYVTVTKSLYCCKAEYFIKLNRFVFNLKGELTKWLKQKTNLEKNSKPFTRPKQNTPLTRNIVDILEKYDKKVTRMFNEMSQKYERLKKSGKKDVTYYRYLTQKTTLNYQNIEAKALRVDFLERYIDQSKLLEKVQDELEEVFKRDRESEQPTT